MPALCGNAVTGTQERCMSASLAYTKCRACSALPGTACFSIKKSLVKRIVMLALGIQMISYTHSCACYRLATGYDCYIAHRMPREIAKLKII